MTADNVWDSDSKMRETMALLGHCFTEIVEGLNRGWFPPDNENLMYQGLLPRIDFGSESGLPLQDAEAVGQIGQPGRKQSGVVIEEEAKAAQERTQQISPPNPEEKPHHPLLVRGDEDRTQPYEGTNPGPNKRN